MREWALSQPHFDGERGAEQSDDGQAPDDGRQMRWDGSQIPVRELAYEHTRHEYREQGRAQTENTDDVVRCADLRHRRRCANRRNRNTHDQDPDHQVRHANSDPSLRAHRCPHTDCATTPAGPPAIRPRQP